MKIHRVKVGGSKGVEIISYEWKTENEQHGSKGFQPKKRLSASQRTLKTVRAVLPNLSRITEKGDGAKVSTCGRMAGRQGAGVTCKLGGSNQSRQFRKCPTVRRLATL